MYSPTPVVLPLVALLVFLLAPEAPAGAGEPQSSAFHATDRAIMRFAAPRRFALVLHEPEEAPRLYKSGDRLRDPGGKGRLLEVERIERDRLILRDRETGRRRSLPSRQRASAWDGLVYLGTVSLTEIQYQFETSDRVRDTAPLVLSLTGARAVLIQQVPAIRPEGRPAPSPRVASPAPERRGDPATVHGGSPARLQEGAYEVDGNALAPTLDKLRKKLAQGLSGITQALLTGAPLLPVRSSVGNGVLTNTGFTVTEPKVAGTFGIEVGDTIVALNGKPVSSPLNAYWTFQEVFIRETRRTIRVDLVRGGKPVTQIYTIR